MSDAQTNDDRGAAPAGSGSTGPVPRGIDGPLKGVRVLDLTSVIMGPLATQILGDLGADVLSIETPEGDTNRAMGKGPHPELSGISLNILRNKRSIAIDLKRPEGREAFLRLAARSDVVVTNLRPGPELLDDPRFATRASRIENSDSLYQDLAGCLQINTTEFWLELAKREGVPATRAAHRRARPHSAPRIRHDRVRDRCAGGVGSHETRDLVRPAGARISMSGAWGQPAETW